MSFNYRPPLKNLLQVIPYTGLSVISGIAIGIEPVWVNIIIIFFFIVTLACALAFLSQYLLNVRKDKKIILTDTYIQLALRWNDETVKLNYTEIDDILMYETYTGIIEIFTKDQSYIIEKNWLENEEVFKEIHYKLKEKLT